ncbi:hypothetical protein [Acanthopleuribacter pedis]|uniref:Glycosyltransferase RgtA/B/C/D-like domain-containing protein n=1 Tax=Acanthopleuribacter pedis TaxID=442870 RepID=A0A8J7Q4I7_9BACT|nr:hypothetical protein [Acanthopleuribacter pedis]MBO1320452.1 hypothetical protein [Acanthopleuribacter pedis]
MNAYFGSDSGHEQDLSIGSILAIIFICLVAYAPLADTGILNDDRVFLDYAARLTWNPARSEVADYVFHGQVLRDFVVFESTHPPLIPYYLRLLQTALGPQWGDHLFFMHLAFAPFLILAALGCAGLIRRTTEQPGWLALALVLGPLFLPNAVTLMADVPLFAFWVGGLWFWERAMDRSGRAAVVQYTLALFCAWCAVFTAYQGLGLLVLMALRGVGRGRVGETLVLTIAVLAPFVLWLGQVYYNHGIFPYFAPPREALSITTEVNKGLVLENIWAKTRVMVLYLGAALGFFAPFSTAFRGQDGPAYPLLACLGWGWVLVLPFVGVGFPGWLPWLFTALGLAFVALIPRALKELATDREYALWWFTLLVWAGGMAMFQMFLAAFASPRYNLLLLGATFLALLKTLPAVPAIRGGLLLATLLSVVLGWTTAQSERTFSHAQDLSRLPLPEDPSQIHVVGEMGVRFTGERLGMTYLQKGEEQKVRRLLIPHRTDRIAVDPSLMERAELVQSFEIENPWPIQLRDETTHTNFYVHARGILPYRFGRGIAERYDLYRVYQPVLPPWQPEASALRPLGPITADAPFAMNFMTAHDGLTRLRINLATYNRINRSTLIVTIEDDNGPDEQARPLWRQTVDAATLQDNAWLQLDFEPLASARRPLRLTLTSPDAAVDSAVTLWVDGGNSFDFNYAGVPQAGRPAVELFCLPRTEASAVQGNPPLPTPGAPVEGEPTPATSEPAEGEPTPALPNPDAPSDTETGNDAGESPTENQPDSGENPGDDPPPQDPANEFGHFLL